MEPPELKLKNCPGEAWVGNGKCDDEVNIPECNYDGGDCCMEPYVQGFCTICVCYENWLEISREINYLYKTSICTNLEGSYSCQICILNIPIGSFC